MDTINLATVEHMWRREVEAASTYAHLAERESDPKRKEILLRLAAQEENASFNALARYQVVHRLCSSSLRSQIGVG